MRHPLLQLALAAALAAGAVSAQAETMSLSGWKFGSGNAVQASAPVYNGQAGGFTGTLSNAGALSGAIDTYCVDLGQFFSFGASYGEYSVVTALTQFGNTKSVALGRLMSYVVGHAGAVDTSPESTSLQLAVWNIVYDSDLTLAGGAFSDTSGYASYATTLLANSASQALTQDIYVLASSTHQDQLFWRAVPTGGSSNAGTVPEPMSLALVGVALAGLAATRRRAKA